MATGIFFKVAQDKANSSPTLHQPVWWEYGPLHEYMESSRKSFTSFCQTPSWSFLWQGAAFPKLHI